MSIKPGINQRKTVAKSQILKDYRQRLRDNIKSLRENFAEILRLAKIEGETQVNLFTQFEQDQYELHVRTSNMSRAAENLIKLITDLKQFMILNDFAFVNETVTQTNTECQADKQFFDEKVANVKEDVTLLLSEIENEFLNQSQLYSDFSQYK